MKRLDISQTRQERPHKRSTRRFSFSSPSSLPLLLDLENFMSSALIETTNCSINRKFLCNSPPRAVRVPVCVPQSLPLSSLWDTFNILITIKMEKKIRAVGGKESRKEKHWVSLTARFCETIKTIRWSVSTHWWVLWQEKLVNSREEIQIYTTRYAEIVREIQYAHGSRGQSTEISANGGRREMQRWKTS